VLAALSTIAVLLGGLLAGLSIDRSLVALPAWRHVGPEAWAAFSRHADLGHGLILYPLLGLGAPLFSIAAALSFALGDGPGGAAFPVYLAAVLSVAHVVATARAAPNMLVVRRTGDPTALAAAFAGFERWQAIRAALQGFAFVANVWALIAVHSP
jgi:hypothetical protein